MPRGVPFQPEAIVESARLRVALVVTVLHCFESDALAGWLPVLQLSFVLLAFLTNESTVTLRLVVLPLALVALDFEVIPSLHPQTAPLVGFELAVVRVSTCPRLQHTFAFSAPIDPSAVVHDFLVRALHPFLDATPMPPAILDLTLVNWCDNIFASGELISHDFAILTWYVKGVFNGLVAWELVPLWHVLKVLELEEVHEFQSLSRRISLVFRHIFHGLVDLHQLEHFLLDPAPSDDEEDDDDDEDD